MLQVKLLAKCRNWSGKFVSRSRKKSGKVRELILRFLVGSPFFGGGGEGGPNIFVITLHSWCNTFYDLVLPFMSFLPKSYIHM